MSEQSEDFSCEIHKPLAYLDFIRDYLGTLQQQQKDSDVRGIRLSPNDVTALSWMLSEAGTIIHQINTALYIDTKTAVPDSEDFSGEIQKPLAYIDFIRDYLGTLQSQQKDMDVMGIRLSPNNVHAFEWMLSEAGTTIHQINTALYGEKGD